MSSFQIARGAVIKCYITTTIPPKTKYFIILGVDENEAYYCTALINTEVNPYLIRNGFESFQVKLEVAINTFLDYDSYADCSEIYKISKPYIDNKLSVSPNIYPGQLSFGELNKVLEKVKRSPLNSGEDLDKIGLL